MISSASHWFFAGVVTRLCPLASFLLALNFSTPDAQAADGVFYKGGEGPGHGHHIVFLTGDEEYRSEEGLPMLAKILATRHGFDCTVLFSINAATGEIDPDCQTNEPGIEALDTADLCVMLLRFREWPDAQMKHFVDYLNAGKPIIALRTSTHAFAYTRNKNSPYAKYDWSSTTWPGGFGRQVLGDTWISHHGDHGKESTRGVINPAHKEHPILRNLSGSYWRVEEVVIGGTNKEAPLVVENSDSLWWPTDVYTVEHLQLDAQVLVWGQVLSGMNPNDPPVTGPKNDPLMPLVWVRDYKGDAGKTSKIVATTAGAAVDLENEALRRLLVNACYWAVGLEDKIPTRVDVSFVDGYNPSFFGFGKAKKGVKPADFKIGTAPVQK
jgi:hypothetical protein